MLARRSAHRPLNILRTLDTLGREGDLFSNMLDDLFHFHGFSPLSGIKNPDFSPALDFAEKDDKFVATLEVPGIEKENIQIEIEEDSIIIKGEKKTEKEDKTTERYVCERCYGSFRREINLPSNIDSEKIDASYNNGILTIDIPKKEESKVTKKKIEVK